MNLLTVVLLIAGIHVVTLVPLGLWMGAWMRRQADPVAAHFRFCGVVMISGFVLLTLGPVFALMSHRATTGLALLPTGSLIIASMMLKRRQLARMMAARIRPATA